MRQRPIGRASTRASKNPASRFSVRRGRSPWSREIRSPLQPTPLSDTLHRGARRAGVRGPGRNSESFHTRLSIRPEGAADTPQPPPSKLQRSGRGADNEATYGVFLAGVHLPIEALSDPEDRRARRQVDFDGQISKEKQRGYDNAEPTHEGIVSILSRRAGDPEYPPGQSSLAAAAGRLTMLSSWLLKVLT